MMLVCMLHCSDDTNDTDDIPMFNIGAKYSNILGKKYNILNSRTSSISDCSQIILMSGSVLEELIAAKSKIIGYF